MNQKQKCLMTDIHLLSGLPADSPVLLGLSGGADSRTLLDLLSAYCKKNSAVLYAAHINHKIRGKDAERDRDFCLSLAREYGIKCFVLECDVPALAKQCSQGLEETARQVRYGFFEKLMRENNIPILATAHNADDNLETLLFNITRGCGLKGLCAIPPSRPFGNGVLVRPLLETPKMDIINYCREKGLEYVTDVTNDDSTYSRNRIRHNIIPELKKINPSILSSASRLANAARQDEELFETETEKYLAAEGREAYKIKNLRKLHPSVLYRVIAYMYSAASGGGCLEQTHISAVSDMIAKGCNRSAISLPRLIRARIENGYLEFVGDPRKQFRHL